MWSVAEHMLQAHGVVGAWLVGGGLLLYSAAKYLPRPILEVIALLTKDERRRLVCLEMIRLRRKDAASLPTYLPQKQQADSGKIVLRSRREGATKR